MTAQASSTAAGGPATRRHRIVSERAAYGTVGVLVVLLVWQFAAQTHLVKTVLVSSPSAIAATAVQEFETGAIWPDMYATFSIWFLGFLIASALGIAIGLVSGRFRRVRVIADAWLNATNVAPDLAFVPILILWFGIGLTFKLVLVVLTGTFYIAVNTLAGVKSAEGRFLRVSDSYCASQLRTFRTVIVPGAMPYIMTGLRLGSGRTIIAIIIAEFVSANQGIGFMMSVSASFLETDKVMFGILLLATLGFLISEVLGQLEHRFDAWRPAAK
jgi:NitT/TauT family transport system permease protein